jgi:hypothetical protein
MAGRAEFSLRTAAFLQKCAKSQFPVRRLIKTWHASCGVSYPIGQKVSHRRESLVVVFLWWFQNDYSGKGSVISFGDRQL